MKTMKLVFVFVLALGFLIAGANTAHARITVDKVLAEKTFEVNPDAILLIDHEFGDINCQNWDKNSIYIKVTVHIESGNEQDAQKIINRIQLNISGDRNKVSSICSLNNSSDKVSNISIDIEVFMPKTVGLQLKHKFGSAYIESVGGPTKIKSEYGSVKIISLLNTDSKMDLSFGSADIEKMTDGNLGINYSSLTLKDGNNMKIDSKYSDLELGNLQSGNITVEGGSAEIKNINSLVLQSKFSSIEVGNLSGSLQAGTEYGSLEVKFIKAGFSTLDVENKFGGVELGIDKSASYEVQVQTNFGDFDYPESLAQFSNKFTTATGSSYSGKIGKSSGGSSKLIAKSSYGSIEVSAR
ncbi:MAG TPA: DUF4097 family beta strand repeat-containing protein [Bacteroidales bacterium]